MARRGRYFLPGATYHVMMRGNNGQSIFSSDIDRCKFCLLIQEGVERYGHFILAFCFMTNHVHLAIQIKDVSLSKICQNLAFRYTRFYNRRHKTTGHLFQGRYKSILVDSNSYLKELIRYIHLNPVRAKLKDNPFDYRWSSHQAYLMQEDFVWLSKDNVLQLFGQVRQEAVEAYNNFVLSGMERCDEVDFKKGTSEGILGDEIFIDRVQEEIDGINNNAKFSLDLNTLISVITTWYDVDLTTLQMTGIDRKMTHIRAMTALMAKKSEGVKLQQLDVLFRRSDGTMSQSAARLEVRMCNSDALKSEFDRLQEELFSVTDCRKVNNYENTEVCCI